MTPATMTIALAVIATLVTLAYVCRLDAISWHSTRWRYIVVHLALIGMAADAAVALGMGRLDPRHVAALAVATLWLLLTFREWRHGPPVHARIRR
jgi:hypothetical protein